MHGRMGRRIGVFVACMFVLVGLVLPMLSTADAVTTNATLKPISTISSSAWTVQGSPGSTCSGICDYIDESASDGDTSYINGANTAVSTGTFGIGGSAASGQTATSLTVHVDARANGTGLGAWPLLQVNLTIGGVPQTMQSFSVNAVTYQGFNAVFTGSWSKSDVDNAVVTLSKTNNLLTAALRVTTMEVTVAYESPAQNQNAVRLYTNADNIAPGAPLAATNTAAEASKDVPFRLRLGLTPSDVNWVAGSWGAHANTYKLQYAQLTAGSCSSQVTGWSDVVSGSGAIRWHDNPSVANNAAIGSIGANDPTTSGSKVYQTYRELNGFTNTSTIPIGDTGIWDFSLVSSGQPAGLSFCFRIVQNDNAALNTYTAYPQATLIGDLGVEFVDAGGSVVTSPTVPFSSTATATTLCNSTTATLGVSSQRLRTSNALVTNGWNVSIAATNGPTSLWSTGALYYDFNDAGGSPAGCSDSGDSDAWPGRLTVNPSGATIAPSSGCTATGISKGISAAFAEGATDAISLLSADATSQRFCHWDVTGISLSQQIPSLTQPGTYSLDMTITVTAQ